MGNDSWATFVYLLGADVPITKDFEWVKKPSTDEEKQQAADKAEYEKSIAEKLLEWLRKPLVDKEKDSRRKQILKVLLELKSFVPTIEEPFYAIPTTPPSIPVEEDEASWGWTVFKVGALGITALTTGYVRTVNQSNAAGQ